MSVIIPSSHTNKNIRHLYRIVVYALIAFLFINIIAGLALSDNGGYIIVPNNSNYETMDSGYEGDTAQISFWELSLWIKLFYLSSTLSALISMALLLPQGIMKVKSMTGWNSKNILACISDNPGCTVSEISKQEGVPRGTVRYYIEHMRNNGKISVQKAGKYLRIFPKLQSADEKEKIMDSFIQSKNYMMLIWMILYGDGVTNQKLSEQLNIDKSQTYRHIQKLLENSIIIFKT